MIKFIRQMVAALSALTLGSFFRITLFSGKARIRSLVYDALQANKGSNLFCVNGGENSFLINLSDTVIGRSLFCSGTFDLQKLTIARDLIAQHEGRQTSPDVLMEVGANIGTI